METAILHYLKENDQFNSLEFAKKNNCNHLELVGHLKSLTSDDYLVLNQEEIKSFILTNDGKIILENGKLKKKLYLNLFINLFFFLLLRIS